MIIAGDAWFGNSEKDAAGQLWGCKQRSQSSPVERSQSARILWGR